MGLQRLAISNPSAATSTTLYTSTNQLLASVIATNKSTTTSANVTVWIQPSGSASASQYAYIVYELPIDASNSFETFRFAVNQNDVIKIQSSTADVSFSAYGMIQYDINLGVGISSFSSSSPSYPVDGLIWVDSDGTSINSLPNGDAQQLPNYNKMHQQDNTPLVNAQTPGMEGFLPMAANEAIGGSFGSSW